MARFKRGTTPKLSRELIDTIAAAMKRGQSIQAAVAACGISKDSFYRWLHSAKGRHPNPLLCAFSEAIEEAKAHSKRAKSHKRGIEAQSL